MTNSPLELLARQYGNVVQYDADGNPSIFCKFPKMKSSDLDASLPDHTHPAFVINSKEEDNILIGKYMSVELESGGTQYSLPNMPPRVSMHHDTFLQKMRAFGNGASGITIADHGFMLLLAHKNKWEPHGNNYWGCDYRDATPWELAKEYTVGTVRSFTNSRKALLKILRKYDASIRYVERGFSHAVRRTDVDVALINVNIPAANEDTTIWDNLKRAREEHLETNGLHEVAPANQVERLIREYDLLCSAGIQMMRVYNGVSDRIMCSSKSDYNRPIIGLIVDGDKTDKCGTGHINTFLRAARARYWRELFDLPELRQKMTSAMQDEYHSTIERMKDYEFSQFNIQQVVNQIMGQIVTGVEEAIVKCFDKLSAEHSYHSDVQNENIHYYNGWKTNKAHYVNSKCIIPTYGCFARGYKPDKYGRYKDTLEGLDARGCFQVLDDLEKALDYLDKGETPASDLSTKLQHAANSGRTTVSCKYFMVTFYKKGTCHIKFHDQKIVDRLNIYVGRQRTWLPPTYGSVHYDQMDDESKRVVDEFQGREKYEAVINCPNDYIIETKAAPLLLM